MKHIYIYIYIDGYCKKFQVFEKKNNLQIKHIYIDKYR